MAQTHNCAGLDDEDRCHMLDYCQYKLVAANAPGSGEYFCGKDQLTGHCRQNPPRMYLDKEAVLKAVKDAFSNPEHIVGLLMRIERGEFDAKSPGISPWQLKLYNIVHEKALSEKDAEIARLKGVVGRLDSLNTALCCTQGKLGDRIAQQDQELKDLTGRIKALDGWKRTNATYGSPGWSATASAFNEGIDRAIEVMHGNVPMSPESGNVILGSEPPKDEPELVICPEYKICGHIDPCPHAKPHVFEPFSCESPYCSAASGQVRCIPYKEPAKAKDGSMDLPEGAKEIEKEICKQVTEAINSVPGACLEGEIRIKHIPSKATRGPAPSDSGMAKDIGDLTLRMDLVDSRQAHDFRMITHLNKVLSIVGEFGSDRLYKIEERIGALEKKVK